jgi:four helix bundle suffix protein
VINDNSKSQPANSRAEPSVIPPHGGYRKLKSYQMAEIVYDATVVFCERFVERYSRTRDQMVQAARSGKQNIAEGSQVSGTSKASEIKLVGVARASLEELLVDLQDYLRQHGLALWGKDDPKAKAVRVIGREEDRSYKSYRTYFENGDDETAANALICLVHQTNYLLDQQLRAIEKEFVKEGGLNERLYQARINYRQKGGW